MPPTMRLHAGLLAIAVLAALLPKSAEASPLVFTDRATFLNVHTALGLPPLAFEGFDENVWDADFSADWCIGSSMASQSLPIATLLVSC